MVDKELRKYICGWCGNKFEQEVGLSGDKHSTTTDQVKCKKCGNFIKS